MWVLWVSWGPCLVMSRSFWWVPSGQGRVKTCLTELKHERKKKKKFWVRVWLMTLWKKLSSVWNPNTCLLARKVSSPNPTAPCPWPAQCTGHTHPLWDSSVKSLLNTCYVPGAAGYWSLQREWQKHTRQDSILQGTTIHRRFSSMTTFTALEARLKSQLHHN